MGRRQMNDYEAALKRHGGDVLQVAAKEPFELWSMGEAMRMIADLARTVAQSEIERRQVAPKTHQQDPE